MALAGHVAYSAARWYRSLATPSSPPSTCRSLLFWPQSWRMLSSRRRTWLHLLRPGRPAAVASLLIVSWPLYSFNAGPRAERARNSLALSLRSFRCGCFRAPVLASWLRHLHLLALACVFEVARTLHQLTSRLRVCFRIVFITVKLASTSPLPRSSALSASRHASSRVTSPPSPHPQILPSRCREVNKISSSTTMRRRHVHSASRSSTLRTRASTRAHARIRYAPAA